jgi:hypothetical protein
MRNRPVRKAGPVTLVTLVAFVATIGIEVEATQHG